MIEQILKTVGEYTGHIWLILLALWGGTASYLSRIQQRKLPFSLVELAGEWCISGFSGVLTAYICAEAGLSWHMIAFFTGIAGHLGGRGLFMLEQYAKRRLGMFNDPKD